MTKQNSLKRLVRARMADTGQSYTTARRIVLGQFDGERFGGVVADGYLHLPGVHPECTALRVLLANSGVVAPHTGEPPSEALVFGIAGGAGAGAMAFRYDREDLSTFYVTGWNLGWSVWEDGLRAMTCANRSRHRHQVSSGLPCPPTPA